MDRVTGIGGVFFKAADPQKLYGWYEQHLGLKREPNEPVLFRWRDATESEKAGMTVWAIFPKDSNYFQPSTAGFMMNFRVADLDSLLAQLHAEGVTIDPRRGDNLNGRFAWIIDPEGNRIELWEPPKDE